MKSAWSRYSLAIVLLGGLALRLGWALRQGGGVDPRLPDQIEYLKLGQNLLAGKGLVFHDERFDQDVRAYRMSGYPLFVATCGASPLVVRMAQAIIDAATILAVYLLAGKWLSARWSIVAAAVAALNPFLIYFSGLILSETLFTAMLMWAMVLLTWKSDCGQKHRPLAPEYRGEGKMRSTGEWENSGGPAEGEGAGADKGGPPLYKRGHVFFPGLLVLALAVHVRPSILLLPILFAAIVGPYRPLRRLLMRIGLAALLTFAVLFPWALRNRLVLGQWVWLTTNGGITRYDGFHPGATGASDQSFLQCPAHRHVRAMGEVERDRYFSSLANEEIKRARQDRPLQLVRLTFLKLARTWSPLPLSRDFGSLRLYVAAALAYSLPFYALVILGLIVTGPLKRTPQDAGLVFGRLPKNGKVLLFLPAVYFTVVHALTVGSLRYRIPAEPPLAVIAAAGAAAIKEKVDRKKEDGPA